MSVPAVRQPGSRHLAWEAAEVPTELPLAGGGEAESTRDRVPGHAPGGAQATGTAQVSWGAGHGGRCGPEARESYGRTQRLDGRPSDGPQLLVSSQARLATPVTLRTPFCNAVSHPMTCQGQSAAFLKPLRSEIWRASQRVISDRPAAQTIGDRSRRERAVLDRAVCDLRFGCDRMHHQRARAFGTIRPT